MPIKPIDIRRKEFSNGLRGYNQNQVDDFLDAVADEFERTFTDNVRMRDEITNLRERLQQFEDLEGSIRSALIHAEQAANDLRESARREAEALREGARREAELTVKEAQNRAHQMLADSSARVERVQESYEALRDARQKFAADFRQLLHSYAAVMDSVDIASAKEIEASLRERLDTESIAAAREAAIHEGARHEEDADRVVAQHEDEEQEPAATAEPEVRASEYDVEATQPFAPPYSEEEAAEQQGDTSETGTSEPEDSQPEAHEPEAAEPEVEEPEVEPSSVRNEEEQATVVSESPAVEEVDREESGPVPESRSESRSDDFFDRGAPESEPSTEEKQEDSRIFRASRFLRRRGG